MFEGELQSVSPSPLSWTPIHFNIRSFNDSFSFLLIRWIFLLPSQRHQGDFRGVIYKKDCKCTSFTNVNVTSFEHLGFNKHCRVAALILITEFLSNFLSKNNKILILGHFNVHLCCPSQCFVTDLLKL